MGRELYDASPEARAVFDEVSATVGFDVAALCFESDDETLRLTQNAQIALYTCGVAAWSALPESVRSQVTAVAGHSIGEYAALTAAGALSIADGARLVQTRGNLMARSGESRPGTMAAVLGLDREPLEGALADIEGVVVVANDNCPGQLVISGEVAAVQAAAEILPGKGAKRVLPLNVSGAFHSPLMAEPAREMGVALQAVSFGIPSLKVYSNVTSEVETEGWPCLLESQLSSPVRWTESVQHMMRDGLTAVVECGAGEVLSGLMKRIDKSIPSHRVIDAASLEATVAAL